MARVALITDTHAGVRNDNPAFHQYQQRCFDWFFEYLDDYKIKDVVHLGDIYDRRKYINFLSAKRVREDFLDRLESRKIKTHILVGNHDMYYKNTHEVNALDELVMNRYDYIDVVSTPRIINLHGCKVQMLPWITESNAAESMIAINKPKASIAFGHLEVHGFSMHKGHISDHGHSRGIFDKFDKVYSGHYHHRSTIGNVTYLGAFAEYTWNDFDDPRGFSIFDTETGEVEFIQNPYRMFRIIKYDDVADPNILEKIQRTDFSDYKDAYIKLAVVNKENQYAFDMLTDALYKVEPLELDTIEDPTLLIDNEEDTEIDQAEDTQTIIRNYVGGLTLPVDNGKMQQFMIGIYQEALQVE